MFWKRKQRPQRYRRRLNIQSLESRQVWASDLPGVLPEGTTAAIYADHPQQIQPGEIVSFQTVQSSDADAEIAYRLRSKNGEWFTARGFAGNGQWNWDTNGLASGIYYVGSFVRAAGSDVPYQIATTPLTFALTSANPATGGTLTTDHSEFTPGDLIRFQATGVGGGGEYEFAFRLRAVDGQWETTRNYSTDSEWNWDTTHFRSTRYFVSVLVRQIGSPAAYDVAVTPLQIELATAPPLDRLTLSASVANPVAAGTNVVLTAVGEGGGESSDYEYLLRFRSVNSDWQTVQGYGMASQWSWDTSGFVAGDYYLGALARRVGSTTEYEWAATPVTIMLSVSGSFSPIDVLGGPVAAPLPSTSYSTILVATCDSSDAAKQSASFIADCSGDQDEINAAIQALPAAGGTVRLAEGTYDIQAVATTLGGIIIDRSNITLEGSGYSTRLMLADDQFTNVIRIFGDGLQNITVRDMYINGNWRNNYVVDFESNGIKAQSTGANPLSSITVENTFIEDSARLNVFVKARDARIVNNRFGDSGSDSVEILQGPGLISGNYVEIDETTGYVFSTDQANDVTISNNVVQIQPTGRISQSVIRTWGGRYSHIITGNQIRAHGPVNRMLEVNGYVNIISDNIFLNYSTRSQADVNGASLIHDNVFHRTDIVVMPSANWSSAVSNNLLFFGSQIRHEPLPGITAELFEFDNISTSN